MDLLICFALSDDRSGLWFSVIAGPRPAQSFSGLSPAGLMTGSCIYFPQEQGNPVIPQALRLKVKRLAIYIQTQFVPHRKHTDQPVSAVW
jgi:hypothetical protein